MKKMTKIFIAGCFGILMTNLVFWGVIIWVISMMVGAL